MARSPHQPAESCCLRLSRNIPQRICKASKGESIESMKFCNLSNLMALAILLAVGPGVARAQTQSIPPASAASAANATAYQFDVDATKEWIDTKVDLRQGEKLRFAATGSISYAADKKHPNGRTFGPEGLPRNFEDLIHEYAVTNSGHGSLVARLGSGGGRQ